MNDPIQLYPDRPAFESEPEETPALVVTQEPLDERETLTPQERRYLSRQARQKRAQQEYASKRQSMTPLADALRPWLEKRGLPPRCDTCGYSGVLRDSEGVRGYCSCVWGAKTKTRDDTARTAMVDDLRKQREARLRKKLVLPSAYTAYTLDTHPLARFNPALHADIIDWVRGWDWRRGLILRGPYGRGKTAYLVAIMQTLLSRAVDEGWGMLYTGGADMLARLQDGFDDDTYAKTRDELSTVHLLAIDDLGASQQVTKWRQDQYLSIFEARYANELPLFVTTNLSDSELRAHLTERVYWRLVERCDLIDVDGPNLRDAGDVAKWQKRGK